jgi:nitrogen fixation-related uncharacterized protein
MSWNIYLVIIGVFGLVFFSVAIYALNWAIKKGQLRDFDKQASVIFDEEEPEGLKTDAFPEKKKTKRAPQAGHGESEGEQETR